MEYIIWDDSKTCPLQNHIIEMSPTANPKVKGPFYFFTFLPFRKPSAHDVIFSPNLFLKYSIKYLIDKKLKLTSVVISTLS